MKRKIKVCAFSDMHGNLDFEIKPVDIVLIAGDVVPLFIQNYSEDSLIWLSDVFIPWCNKLPCKHVFLVAGNHDWVFERKPDEVSELFSSEDKITYLNCEFAEYDGITIYGTPLCHKFYNWAFMIPDEEQDEIYNEVINGGKKIDILMSHDAPYGVSDVLLQKNWPWATGEHIGCKPLAKFIEKTQPMFSVHGHLHSTNHKKEMFGNTKIYNVSLLDENYKMVYKPHYFTL
jgi:Icc-related predicted phosphoesterase